MIIGICGSTWFAIADTYVVHNRENIGAMVTLGGTVVPYREVTLTAQVPGRIKEIAGKEGDSFEEDTLLISVDDTELLAQRRAAVAQMMNADAALREAYMQYSREWISPNSPSSPNVPGGMGMPFMMDKYFTEPFSSMSGDSNPRFDRQAELHSYGTRIEQARSTLMQVQSQIQQIDAKLRDAMGKAPFDGVITKKLAEVGDTVQPGQPLLMFADMQRLQIQVEVPARLERGLKKGDMVVAKLDVYDRPLEVTVAQIFPIADPQRHTVTVKFDLTPIDIHARPGQYAEVDVRDVNVEGKTLPIIPQEALVWSGSLPSVYVLDETGKKRELRVIRIGKDLGDGYVSVLSGLKEGEKIEIKEEKRNPTY
ncbi:MAG: efflux transporter periplasmic adaptor subunit [Beggiatoa sp. IS2]|nr:MAG: efflux transporter periplasmic adaptor subunit [Beggiatoa sp. IS2]